MGLTHTVTHTRKCSESVGEDMRLILSDALFVLHDLCHEIPHLLGSAFLHLACDVGVGSQCEAHVEVSEHTRYCFHVYAVLQSQGCECMSQVVKSQVFQSSIFQDFLVDVHHRVWVVHFSGFW